MKKNINLIYENSKKSDTAVKILDWIRNNVLIFIPDKLYLKLMYKIKMNKNLDLKNPQTFNEKLQWLKLYDRKDIYTKLVDKYEVRDYISETIGKEYLIPLIGVYDKFDDIDFSKLPNQFVIKCNHDSGSVVICKDKKNFDIKEAKKKINSALRKNYYYNGREWPYKNVKRRIIIEKYLNELDTGDVRDYKFFIFNGKFAYSFVCSDRFNDLKFTFYDREGKFLDIKQGGCLNDSDVSKPVNYQKMIKLAEKLAKDTIQLRVDFYEINDKIYFGELTFYDSSGFAAFEPEEWDLKIGGWLKLPKK